MALCTVADCDRQSYCGEDFCLVHLQEFNNDTYRCIRDLEAVARNHAAFDAWLDEHHLPRENDP